MSEIYCHYTLDQVRESGLLTAERMKEVEEQIEARILPCFGPKGKEIESAKIADMGDKWLLFPRMDHEHNYEYLRRSLLPIVLTAEELKRINESCLDARRENVEAERFEKAEKITDWSGPVYCEGIGYSDGYFHNMEELLDHLDSDDDEEVCERPKYAWACDSNPCCWLDYGSIIEDATQEAHESFDAGQLHGEDELKAALERFNEANKGFVSWTPNYKRAVLIPDLASDP